MNLAIDELIIVNHNMLTNKHVNAQYIVNKNFDLILESGIETYFGSHFSEAISSFSSAIERFYEYCIHVFLYSDNKKEQFNKLWKSISNQSERQLGAFISVFYDRIGVMPEILTNDKRKGVPFRNKIIHKGHKSTKDEAETFLKEVLRIISQNYFQLKKNCKSAIRLYDNICHNYLKETARKRLKEFKKKAHKSIEFTFSYEPQELLKNTFLSKIDESNFDILEINEYNPENFHGMKLW